MQVTILIHGKNRRTDINYSEHEKLFYIFRCITRWEKQFNIIADDIYESSDKTFFTYDQLSNDALLYIKNIKFKEIQLIIE